MSIDPRIESILQSWKERAADDHAIAVHHELLEVLRDVEEFLDLRADVDFVDGRYLPNDEARLLIVVQTAITKAEGK